MSSFTRGLLGARSHLAFLGGLGIALATIWTLTPSAAMSRNGAAVAAEPMNDNFNVLLGLDETSIPTLRVTGRELDETERKWATASWKYFENNTQAATGLVNSVDGYPSTTLWDLGSYAMGLIAARDLRLIDESNFDSRVTMLFASLTSMDTVDGIAPNKAYDTRSLKMVRYDNTETPSGIGWSTLDIARLAVPFQIMAWRFPKHTPAIRTLLGHWQLDAIVKNGHMVGTHRTDDGTLVRVQEGRFGYEQYAAKSLFLLGCDVSRSMRYDLGINVMEVSGQRIAYDARRPEDNDGTHNAVLSEPYVLEALEYGLDATTLPLAASVYKAQEKRHKATGIVTAVSEDHLDRAPFFVYASVLNDGKPWSVFTPDGKDASALRTFSVKAAIGWASVFKGAYADELLRAIDGLADSGRGFYAGRYEKDGAINRALTANTNGIVLEALLYKTRGPLVRAARNAHTPTDSRESNNGVVR